MLRVTAELHPFPKERVSVPPCQKLAFARPFGDLSRTEMAKSKLQKSYFILFFILLVQLKELK